MPFIVGTSSIQDFCDGVPHRLVGVFASLSEARAAVDPGNLSDVTQIAGTLEATDVVEIVETYFGRKRVTQPAPVSRPKEFHADGTEPKGPPAEPFTVADATGRFAWARREAGA